MSDSDKINELIAGNTLATLAKRVLQAEASLEQAKRERDEARRKLVDEVIALITTEQAAMRRLYQKHEYGINKVCNRLKLFVGDLLKEKPHDPH